MIGHSEGTNYSVLKQEILSEFPETKEKTMTVYTQRLFSINCTTFKTIHKKVNISKENIVFLVMWCNVSFLSPYNNIMNFSHIVTSRY